MNCEEILLWRERIQIAEKTRESLYGFLQVVDFFTGECCDLIKKRQTMVSRLSELSRTNRLAVGLENRISEELVSRETTLCQNLEILKCNIEQQLQVYDSRVCNLNDCLEQMMQNREAGTKST